MNKLKVIDFSHSNAYDTLSRPVQTILNKVAAGEGDKDGMLDDFYAGIQSDRDKYKVTRDKIHSIIEVLKTNMISALGIKADYNDSDGD